MGTHPHTHMLRCYQHNYEQLQAAIKLAGGSDWIVKTPEWEQVLATLASNGICIDCSVVKERK